MVCLYLKFLQPSAALGSALYQNADLAGDLQEGNGVSIGLAPMSLRGGSGLRPLAIAALPTDQSEH